MARSTRDSDEALPEIVVFVPGPDGEPLEFAPPPTATEVLHDLATGVHNRLDQVRDLHAASGPRLGATGDRPERRGAPEEVLTPLLLSPSACSKAATKEGFFEPPIPRIDIDTDSLRADNLGLWWRCVVRTGPLTRRAGTLGLYSSPSANVTVLELIPDHPRVVRSWGFVRSGVRALEHLGQRLASQTRSRSHSGQGSRESLTTDQLHDDISEHEYCFPLPEGSR